MSTLAIGTNVAIHRPGSTAHEMLGVIIDTYPFGVIPMYDVLYISNPETGEEARGMFRSMELSIITMAPYEGPEA